MIRKNLSARFGKNRAILEELEILRRKGVSIEDVIQALPVHKHKRGAKGPIDRNRNYQMKNETRVSKSLKKVAESRSTIHHLKDINEGLKTTKLSMKKLEGNVDQRKRLVHTLSQVQWQ